MNEATIRGAILAGACDLDEMARRCGAGSDCGGCLPALRELLVEAARSRPARSAQTSAA